MDSRTPCKFQANCKFYALGTCKNSHDSQPGGQGGMGAVIEQPKRTFNNESNKGMPRGTCNFGLKCRFFRGEPCNFIHPEGGQSTQQPRQQSSQPQFQQQPQPYRQPLIGQSSKPREKKPCFAGANCRKGASCPYDHGETSGSIPNANTGGGNHNQQGGQEFCRNWMKGHCQNNNCKRIHAISIDGSIDRIFVDETIPNHPKSGIGCMASGSTYFLFPRMGNTIYTCQYQAELNKLEENSFKLENENVISISKNEGDWILFGYENTTNKLQNIKAFNLQTQKGYVIENAHQKSITGLTMMNNQVMFSSSRDSEAPIKMWNLVGEQFVLNTQTTQKLQSDIGNPKVNIQFCKFVDLAGTKLLCAGTNDGRLLIWNQGQLKAVPIPPNYVNVYDFDIKNIGDSYIGFILAWTQKTTLIESGVFILDMQSGTVQSLHAEKSTIVKMVITPGNMLITANLDNQVNFYKLQPMPRRIGMAYFDNPITHIEYLEAITSTMIRLRHVLVLESCREGIKNEASKGSLSIFKINQ